jgi:hypothetical protein
MSEQKVIYNKGFLLFLLLAIVISIGYPILNKFCFNPRKWKKELIKHTTVQYGNKIDSELIISFSDCVYNYFKKIYKDVRKFPKQAEYTHQDKVEIYKCTVNNLVTDSLERKFYLEKMDSLISSVP